MNQRVLPYVGSLLGQHIYAADELADSDIEAMSVRLGRPCLRYSDDLISAVIEKTQGDTHPQFWIGLTSVELLSLKQTIEAMSCELRAT